MKRYTLFFAILMLGSLTCFAQNAKTNAASDTAKKSVTVVHKGQPLYILDDVELPGSDIGAVKPEEIESIRYLNQQKEIEPYGEKGRNGVVIITTKKYKAKKPK